MTPLARPDLGKVRHVAAMRHSVWLNESVIGEMNRLHERVEDSTRNYTELTAELAAIQGLYDQADTVLHDLGIREEEVQDA